MQERLEKAKKIEERHDESGYRSGDGLREIDPKEYCQPPTASDAAPMDRSRADSELAIAAKNSRYCEPSAWHFLEHDFVRTRGVHFFGILLGVASTPAPLAAASLWQRQQSRSRHRYGRATAHAEFCEQRLDVNLHRALGELQAPRDLFIR
jgi:hypothetical protein